MKESRLAKRIVLLLIVFISLILFTNTSEAAQTTLKVIVPFANIRAKPDLASPILKRIPSGSVLESEAKEGNWYKVNLPPDASGVVITGYVYETIVQVLQVTPEKAKEEAVKPAEKKAVAPEPVVAPEKKPMPPVEGRRTGLTFRIYGKFGILLTPPSLSDLGYNEIPDWNPYWEPTRINYGAGAQLLFPLGGESSLRLGVDFGFQKLWSNHMDLTAYEGDDCLLLTFDDAEYSVSVLAVAEYPLKNSPIFLQFGAGVDGVFWTHDHASDYVYESYESTTSSGFEFSPALMAAAGIELGGSRMRVPILLRVDCPIRYGVLLSVSVVTGVSF